MLDQYQGQPYQGKPYKSQPCNKFGKKILIIEGNIGAGKSTFLKILSKKIPNIDPIMEPTKKWQHLDNDNNLLNLFYKDTKRWAYTFQSYAFITRVQAQIESLKKNPNKNIQVLERSVFCDRYCFAKNCFENGTISPLEWEIYKEWFAWLVENYVPRPDLFIYLKVSPSLCYSRLKKRNRSEESGVPLKYLEQIHKKHENWLKDKNNISGYIKDVTVLELDCDKDFETDLKLQAQHIEKIENFLRSDTGISITHIPDTSIPDTRKPDSIQV